MTRFDQCRRGPTGRVIGHGGLNTGVDEAVLLEVPGLHVKFRFADPWIDAHEANAEARHERGGIEYPFHFLAWQLVELLHVLGAFLRLTAKLSGAPNFTKSRLGVDCALASTKLRFPGRQRSS